MGMLTLISQYKVRNITDLLLFPRQRDSSRKKMLPKSASRGAAGYELSSNSAAVMGKEVVEVHARADLQEGSIHVVTAGTGVGPACAAVSSCGRRRGGIGAVRSSYPGRKRHRMWGGGLSSGG